MLKVATLQPDIDKLTYAPLTYEQEGQWFLEQLYPSNSAYNRPSVISLKGILNVEALEKSINEIIKRHEVLRAYFPVQEGVPIQAIRPFQYLKLPVLDISNLPLLERNQEKEKRIMEELGHTFDASSDFLFRAKLLKLSKEEQLLLINIHHIVFDGWSMQNFLKEMSRYYKAFILGQPLSLPALPLLFSEYAKKQRELISSELIQRDLTYWRSKLSMDLQELNLPLDFPRSSQPKLEGKTYSFIIPSNVNQNIKSLCRKEKITPFMFIMTILKILVYRYTGQEDISVGSYVSGRNKKEIEPLIGLFANTLVLRTQLRSDMTFLEAVQQVKKISLEAFSYQNVPFTKCIEDINSNRYVNNHPFFQVVLNMHNMPQSNEEVPGLSIEEIDIEHNAALADLTLKITEVRGELKCALIYDKALFEEGTIIRMAGHFNTLVEGALKEQDTLISLLPFITSSEKNQLLVEWNSKAAYPKTPSIQQLFEEQVDLNKDQMALIYGNTQITYLDLERKANQIANFLQASGLRGEHLVAICLDRSPEMIMSFLAVLKAGAAYVPFDLSYPPERIAFMLEDAQAAFVITTEEIAKQLPVIKAKVICLDKESKAVAKMSENRSTNLSGPGSLAYVMYTSGSTGKPKGVAIEHRGINRLVKNINYANVGPRETFLNLTTVAFDVSAFEIYGALLNGGKLVILNSNKPPIDHIARSISQFGVTSLCVGPEMLNLLIEDYTDQLGNLRQILSAGDALPVWLARKCLTKLPECQLINAYGPTENTVYTTSYRVEDILPNATSIPIGQPIADDRVFILDMHLQPVPIGVTGELYLSGTGIARGYLNNPQLTKERFPSAPLLISNGGLYRTGDLARYRSDGNIEFLGRTDNQVKIRGCRIELGEIESVVGMYSGIRETVAHAIKGKDGTAELVAYVVMNKGEIFDQQKIRIFAREKLPEYMVPTFFVELLKIPVTPVGKIDRKNLPAPIISIKEDKVVMPRTKVEEQLMSIWETLLDVRPIGIHDNYFDLGGHSLLAMRMFSEIEKTFEIKLPVSIIFQEDTIEKLSRLISSKHKIMDLNSIVPIQSLGDNSPLFCIHPGNGEVLAYRLLAEKLGKERPIYGLRYVESGAAAETTIKNLASQYIDEIKQIQPKGPYNLLGYCVGGTIAYEMAQQLYQAGKEVSLLAMLNPRNNTSVPKEVVNEINYMKIINNNLKKLFKLSYKEWIPFAMKKIQNVTQLVKNRILPNELNQVQLLIKENREYRPAPYPGKLLIIHGENRNENIVAEKFGWDSVDKGHIYLRSIKGEDNIMMEEPHVVNVAEFLNEYLSALTVSRTPTSKL
ncbi:non-ribosomal peptide synthetase [Neobacillus drentensis]|uniref:non-ribosomal peptide synthetase n=1 Tax=Neobacillus drentensis TaxID=220684 RepID=UPI00285DFEBD|nr:amino acid adenylation domain-containing protein [Neobacillus drentensis]MDR7239959.1 amino acid adenylation domain-containing protein [Neobacillus drentensis]